MAQRREAAQEEAAAAVAVEEEAAALVEEVVEAAVVVEEVEVVEEEVVVVIPVRPQEQMVRAGEQVGWVQEVQQPTAAPGRAALWVRVWVRVWMRVWVWGWLMVWVWVWVWVFMLKIFQIGISCLGNSHKCDTRWYLNNLSFTILKTVKLSLRNSACLLFLIGLSRHIFC